MMGRISPSITRRAAGYAVRFAVITLFVAGLAGAKRLIPVDSGDRAPVQEERAERWQAVRQLLGPPHVHPPSLEGNQGAAKREGPLRVMVCLLAFDENRDPHLTTIPVGGGFMEAADSIPDWKLRVDPPPHNHAYFGKHMEALDEYIGWQSYGKVDIEWDILPVEEEPFRMSDIADYGPGEGGYWTLELLEAFMREGLDTIDAQLQLDPDGPRFADYDHVMIFHAGSDLQNDIAQDSPNDLPSFNIFFGDPDGAHPVDGGDYLLESVLLLPETTIQDVEEGDALGALNAVTAHEFTHQLGTVDTYNTYYFWPVVGYWDLMDSGHQLTVSIDLDGDEIADYGIYGALPASLAIWHKEYLGWIGEEDGSLARLGGGEGDFELTASGVLAPGLKALRVDLSDSEYFLLENRQELLWEGDRYIEQDDATGVIQYVADWVSEENIGEYDLLIPQSGLLAWHIDERNLEQLMDLNAVNMDGDWHFWLIEADGLSDLGTFSEGWRGSESDPFHTGHVTEWLHETVPSTRLKDKSPSGFELTDLVTSDYLNDLNAVDSTITFHASLAGPAPGFPRDDRALLEESLDLFGSANSLMPLGEDGLAYLMASLEPDSSLASYAILGGLDAEDPVQEPLVSLAGLALTTARAEAFREGKDSWFIFVSGGFYELGFDEGGAGLEPLNATATEVPILAGPLVAEDRVVWLDADGGLNIYDGFVVDVHEVLEVGVELSAYSPPSLMLDSGEAQVVYQINDAIYSKNIVDASAPAIERQLPEGREGVAWIRVLDRNGDDIDDLFWIERSGYAASWGSDNVIDNRDPLQAEHFFQYPLDGDSLSGGPAVGDMDGDGAPELFLSTTRHIYRFGTRMHEYFPEAHLYRDWPLRPAELLYLDEPMQVGGAALLADMTGDDLSELLVFGSSGHLMVVNEFAEPILGTPRSMAGEAPADLYAVNGSLRAVSWKGYLIGFDGLGDGETAEWSLAGGGAGRDGRWLRSHLYLPEEGASEADAWVLYPNPVQDWLKLQHPGTGNDLVVKIELFDLEGQRLLERLGYSAGGPFEVELDLGNIAPGVYFLRAEVSRHTEVQYSFVKSVAVLR